MSHSSLIVFTYFLQIPHFAIVVKQKDTSIFVIQQNNISTITCLEELKDIVLQKSILPATKRKRKVGCITMIRSFLICLLNFKFQQNRYFFIYQTTYTCYIYNVSQK
jgi:hypothetical protein